MEGDKSTGLIGSSFGRMVTSFVSAKNPAGVPKEKVWYSKAFYELPQKEGREGGAA